MARRILIAPHRSFFVIGMMLLSTVTATELAAQAPGFGAPSTTPANEIAEFKGKLKGMRRGVVLVEKEDGTQAMVALPDAITSFQFVAKATPAFLQRGMLVRFSGTFGPTGLPVAPISKVTLFQPVDLRSVQGRAKEQFTPGVHSDANRGNRQPMMTGKLTIVGRLIGLAPGGIMAVQAGKVPVRVPVDQNTQLEVRYNNLTLAQEGDPVSVTGFYQPPNVNQIKADRITVTTDRVYGEYKGEADKKSKRKGAAPEEKEKGDEEDGDKENKEADEEGDEKADAEDPKDLPAEEDS